MFVIRERLYAHPVVLFPVLVSYSSIRLKDTGSCRYAHVKVEKWKDIFKLTRSLQSDNSIIKTIKAAMIVHPKKNILLILTMFKRSRIVYDTCIC
jgi:hypothetical protein